MRVGEARFSEAKHPAAYATAYDAIYRYIEWRGGLHIVNAHNLVRKGRVDYTSNHEHALDMFAIGIALGRGMKVPGKQELKSWRYGILPGYILEYLGGELFDRDGSANEAVGAVLDGVKQDGVAMNFIERTRKNPIALFHPEQGPAWLAIKASTEEEICPLVPIGLSTSELRFGKPIQMVVGEAFCLPEETPSMSYREQKQLRRDVTWDIGRRVLVLREEALRLHHGRAGLPGRIVWS